MTPTAEPSLEDLLHVRQLELWPKKRNCAGHPTLVSPTETGIRCLFKHHFNPSSSLRKARTVVFDSEGYTLHTPSGAFSASSVEIEEDDSTSLLVLIDDPRYTGPRRGLRLIECLKGETDAD